MKNNDIFDFNSIKMNFSSVVFYYDSNSNSYEEHKKLYDNENRVWVDIENVPENMKNAFISIEDERFLTHHGVDIKRTMGAFVNWIFKGNSSYGGSTITQQLVKNITGDDKRSPVRKIVEMWRSLYIEGKYSKDEILEMYVNTIYLGQGCNGVQAASDLYFNKTVSELSLAECASIAGITQYPARYDPILNPEANKEKQEIILNKMYELGMISKEERDEAINEKLVIVNHKTAASSNIHSYFIDNLIEEIIDDLVTKKNYSRSFAEKMVYTGGLKIYSTIDPKVQNAMESVYENTANFPISGCQGAMVILDPRTGEIKGLVGGIGEKSGNRVLNRATQTLRSPGSTMKPIGIFAPAVDKKLISPDTVMDDKAIDINGWKPVNYYKGYKGKMTVRRAVELSVNTIPVQLFQKLGAETSFDYAKNRFGLSSLVDSETRNGKVYSDKNGSALALGGTTDGVSVIDMAAAYAVFPNKGYYIKPYSYTKIEDRNGKLILEKDIESKIAIKESTADTIVSMLYSVCLYGTGTGARFGNIQAAGKTGTTDDNFDRWFIGFTPYYVGSCWYGNDYQQTLNLSSNPCVTSWRRVMEQIHNNKSGRSFPSEAVSAAHSAKNYVASQEEVLICEDSGLLATEMCKNDPTGNKAKSKIFEDDNSPKNYCTLPHDNSGLTEPIPEPEITVDMEDIPNEPTVTIEGNEAPEVTVDIRQNATTEPTE